MRNWWRRLFGGKREDADLAAARDAEFLEILEAVQKSSRAQARLAAQLAAIESKVEAGFADTRALVSAREVGPGAPESFDGLLDAIDLLEAAMGSLGDEAREAKEGLHGVIARLDRFLRERGLARVPAPARVTDGKLFRVVGTEQRPDLADGVVARVVRAAVLDGDRLVREGEVTINRSAPAEQDNKGGT